LNDIKKKKELKEQAICRDILKEILNFGVSEHQKKFLISLLALELEDTNTMKRVKEAIEGKKENSNKLIINPKELK
jgi:hypothetical protein